MLGPQVTGSRRDQEEGGGAGPSSYRVQARPRGGRWCWHHKLQGPGEIKREVVLGPQVTGSRRDQEGGCAGPSSYRVQARPRGRLCWALKLQGPGETKRREVVLGPVVSSEEIMNREVELGPVVSSEEIMNREVVLGPVVSSEEIMNREVELGCESWTFLQQVVTQQRCNRRCPFDSAKLKQQLCSMLVSV